MLRRCAILGLLILTASLSACNLPVISTPIPDIPGNVLTLAAKTMQVIQSQYTPTSTRPTALPVPSETPAPEVVLQPATETTIWIATLTPSPTNELLPSLTPLYTQFSPTATPVTSATGSEGGSATPGGTPSTGTPTPCNAAEFIQDTTIPDGMEIPANLPFTKVWRVKNVGDCTWDTSYSMVFSSGDRMKGKTSPLQKTVRPGEIIDIPVNMTVPSSPGNYKGNWLLQTGSTTFGSGSSGTRPFFIQIESVENDRRIVYNFALSFCAANWESNLGSLTCPGIEGNTDGFAFMLHNPILETRPENEPALWMHPAESGEKWISGTFPQIEVQAGDRFQADLGCLKAYNKCNVNFELWYRILGINRKKIGVWQEYNDSHVTRLDIDLSSLAGESVNFILVVYANNNPSDAQAFWLMPQIRRP